MLLNDAVLFLIYFPSLGDETTSSLDTKKQPIANILTGMFRPNTRRVNLIIQKEPILRLDVKDVM